MSMMSVGELPEMLSQRILAGTISEGRLGVSEGAEKIATGRRRDARPARAHPRYDDMLCIYIYIYIYTYM